MDELVKPLNEVQIDDTEFACLKAIVFFDPSKYTNFFSSFFIDLCNYVEDKYKFIYILEIEVFFIRVYH